MAKILKIPENTQGRDFVVGDIHGMYDSFDRALEAVSFDPARDRVFSVGDLTDRGPRSADCLYYLSQPWFFPIRGNHEEMVLECINEDGSVNDGFIKAYLDFGLGWIWEQATETRRAIREHMADLPFAIETQTDKGSVGFVHADIPAGMSWEQFKRALSDDEPQTIMDSAWGLERLLNNDGAGVDGIDRIFFGHKEQPQGVKNLGNCFYVDTGAVRAFTNARWGQPGHLTLANIKACAADLTTPVTIKPQSGIFVIPQASTPKLP